MVKNKVNLIYENVKNISDRLIVGYNNDKEYAIFKDEQFIGRYSNISEVLKGKILLIKNGMGILCDTDLNIIKEGNIQEIVYMLANELDNLSYEEIINAINRRDTSINRKIYEDKYTLRVSIPIYIDIINRYEDTEVLSIEVHSNDANSLDSIFVGGKREASFKEYNKLGYDVTMFDNYARIIRENRDNLLSVNKEMILNRDKVISTTKDCRIIRSDKEYSLVGIYNNSNLYTIYRLDSYGTRIIDDGIIGYNFRGNKIIIHKENGSYLYNVDMTKKLNKVLTLEIIRYHIRVYSYIDNGKQQKVYLGVDNDVSEITRTSLDSEIILKRIKSMDKVISGMTLMVDKDTDNVVGTLITLNSKLERLNNKLYTNMLDFWGHIEPIENKFGLKLFTTTSVYTGYYYLVDSNGNILDKNSYESREEIQDKYIDAYKLRDIKVEINS